LLSRAILGKLSEGLPPIKDALAFDFLSEFFLASASYNLIPIAVCLGFPFSGSSVFINNFKAGKISISSAYLSGCN
jgi:hypothetical protein